MLKKITFGVLFLILVTFFYFAFIFDINNYKSQFENIISEQTNTEFTISGNLELDVGTSTRIKAELLSVQKNNVLILEATTFTADVSLSQILQAKFDINSISLIDSKLYGVDVDETIVQTYNLLSGKRYSNENRSYSNVKSIFAKGNYSDGMLQINEIQIRTDLLKANGFGKIIPDTQSLSISMMSTIVNDDVAKDMYREYYPVHLENTQVPILISGTFNSPEVDVKISDVISQKIKQEIKNKTIESIKDKIKEKIQSDVNIKLPF